MAKITPAQIRKVLALHGIEHAAEPTIAGLRRAVRIDSDAMYFDEIPIGSSKLGGSPDLPPGTEIPKHRGKDLTLIAQVDLAEVNRRHIDIDLPRSGLLSFFFAIDSGAWGSDESDKGSAVVLYTEAGSEFERTLGNNDTEEAPFQLVPVKTLPIRGTDFDQILEGEEEHDALFDAYRYLISSIGDVPFHHIGGHPSRVQTDMPSECQAILERLYPKSGTEGDDGWTLLAQFGCDEDFDWAWGDSGYLYFWIRETDLAARDFSRVWAIVQSY